MFRTLLLLLACSGAFAQTPLKVKTSPGVHALPIIAAVSQGIFERQGLKVEILLTGSSRELRDGLAAGEFQIAQFAADNAVAMAAVAGHDVVIVAGGGQTVIVDAPDTASAVLLKKILPAQGWAAANADTLQRYLAGFIEGTRCVLVGLARDARFDMQGFRNLLALRAEIEGTWGGKAPSPERYFDLRYYEAALRRIAP